MAPKNTMKRGKSHCVSFTQGAQFDNFSLKNDKLVYFEKKLREIHLYILLGNPFVFRVSYL